MKGKPNIVYILADDMGYGDVSCLNQDRSFLKPATGGDKLMRDPAILPGPDGIFRMVWTVSWGKGV